MLGLRLSICIATYNRGRFLGETLESILSQLQPGVEVILVDGASPDNTAEVVQRYASRYPDVHYYREHENSGVDRDYDKAVGYATGEYCWLMTDDDLLVPGAISRVLAALESRCNLLVVNTELRNFDFSHSLVERRLDIREDLHYKGGADAAFFVNTINHLSFIGAVIIKRAVWCSRNRLPYYGSLYVHVGVIFQHPPIEDIRIIAQPLILVRHYNAMWAPRVFEIQMFKWPELVWSFRDFSDSSKTMVCQREPWRRFRALLYNRAIGSYSTAVYRKYLSTRTSGMQSFLAFAIALVPAGLANFLAVAYYWRIKRSARLAVSDLLHSNTATAASKFLARAVGLAAGPLR